MAKASEFSDPFKAVRETEGIATIDDQNDPVFNGHGVKRRKKVRTQLEGFPIWWRRSRQNCDPFRGSYS